MWSTLACSKISDISTRRREIAGRKRFRSPKAAERKQPCPPLNGSCIFRPRKIFQLVSFPMRQTVRLSVCLSPRPSSAVSHDQKPTRSTKYTRARIVHLEGHLLVPYTRQVRSESGRASFPPPPSPRILRIIMNEEKKKKKKKEKRKGKGGGGGKKTARYRVRRGCKASRARDPCFARRIISNDTFFPCKCCSFIQKIDNGSRILDNPFSPTITLPFPNASFRILCCNEGRFEDKISAARLSARANRKLHGRDQGGGGCSRVTWEKTQENRILFFPRKSRRTNYFVFRVATGGCRLNGELIQFRCRNDSMGYRFYEWIHEQMIRNTRN